MLSRFRRTDDGSVAVLAAVTIPVVLLAIALAVAAMVWASSEHETQRAADAAAVRAAATAFLGADYPYQEIPGLTEPVTYPDVQAIAAALGLTAPDNLDDCGTVGLPPGPDAALTLPGISVSLETELAEVLGLPVDCTPVEPFVVPPALGLADQTRSVACQTARDAMAAEQASFSHRFYAGTGDAQPSCADRIAVRMSTGSPLVGFGSTVTSGATLVPQLATVRSVLAALGIRLDTSLPSLICPEVSVAIDQPVREPVFDRASAPNGRATARRVVKNAVVVPVFEGAAIEAAAEGAVSASAGPVGVVTGTATGTTVTIPPRNLNATLIAAQRQLLTLLDEVDAIADAAIKAANVSVDELNGVYTGIDPVAVQAPPVPGTAPLDGLRLTKCLRDSLAQVFDPPSGDAPTAAEVLASAAENGEQVMVVQVGAVEAACTEPGAIPYDVDVSLPAATPTPECIRAATAPRLDPLTGIYEVPFFDVTPVLVQDIGDQNYAAVPLHASQAAGAFRAALVRAPGDERYDPDVRQPVPTPLCDVTVPLPTPSTACGILDVTPPPTPTAPATPTLPVVTLTPTPSSTCLLLCGVWP